MADAANLRYLCKTCNAMFWLYSDVVLHKGATGHGEYEISHRNWSHIDTQSEA